MAAAALVVRKDGTKINAFMKGMTPLTFDWDTKKSDDENYALAMAKAVETFVKGSGSMAVVTGELPDGARVFLPMSNADIGGVVSIKKATGESKYTDTRAEGYDA